MCDRVPDALSKNDDGLYISSMKGVFSHTPMDKIKSERGSKINVPTVLETHLMCILLPDLNRGNQHTHTQTWTGYTEERVYRVET